MKRIKNIYRTVCLAGLVAVGATSCTEWLTIYPQDRVVEDEFWEDKQDLEGVRYAAYRQMAGTIDKLAVWGDLRSDTYKINRQEDGSQSNRLKYIDIMNGQPDSSMSIFDWGGVYKTINLCNKVLQHGEEILAKDKQFTSQEWKQMEAEMRAMRALNYFYLIRAFKDVPYTTKVVNSDTEVRYDTLMPQLQVLDSIILDCERVKGKARDRFTSLADTKGMITNAAIYAMLADMCLWRASLHEGRHEKTVKYLMTNTDGVRDFFTYTDDYALAAAYADTCLMRLAEQNLAEQQSSSQQQTMLETYDCGLGSNYMMIKNTFRGINESLQPKLEAMTEIFLKGNSVESILELQFRASDDFKNDMVNSFYGYNKSTLLEVNADALKACYSGGIDGEDTNNGGAWDSRLWVSCQKNLTKYKEPSSADQPGYYCMKYCIPGADDVNVIKMTPQTTGQKLDYMVYLSQSYNHWILYRMTDVMLIKAEALVHTGAAGKKEALRLCTAIRRRSYGNYKDGSVPDENASNNKGPGTIATSTNVSDVDADKWVLNERQVELLGEGKRWFDLVRFAERNSYSKTDAKDSLDSNVPNGFTGMKKMVDDFFKAANPTYATTLQNRFKNRWGLYNPIYYMDIKASNYAIRQNPVWNKSKYEQ